MKTKKIFLFILLYFSLINNVSAYSYTGKEMNVVYIVGMALLIIRIVVPILLIVVSSIDLIKAMTGSSDKEINKILMSILPKVIAAIIIFLLPYVLLLLLKLTNQGSTFSSYSTCLLKPSGCNSNLWEEPTVIEEKPKTQYPTVSTHSSDEGETEEPSSAKSYYSNVKFNNFSWKYYERAQGPLKNYYSSDNRYYSAYAVWGPSSVSDLNGVSLPLIIWLHGAGETKSKLEGKYFVKNGVMQKLILNWGSFNLEPMPAIVVAPHATGSFAYHPDYYISTIIAAIKFAQSEYNIDTSKVVLMGHSMGADDLISLGYIISTRYTSNYFSAYVSISPSHYIADKSYSAYNKEAVLNFYKAKKMKGYTENTNCKPWFDWTGKELVVFRGVGHFQTPQKAFTEDKDKNGISDLVEWLFLK